MTNIIRRSPCRKEHDWPRSSWPSVWVGAGTLRYERALRYLVSEGALVWEQRLGGAPGVDFYVITRRGLEMLVG